MLIAAMGIPGSGKSSAFKLLSIKYNLSLYEEAKEKDWPKLVGTRDTTGYFTSISWFRSVRVPQLYEADAKSKEGRTVLIDSYYDKLISGYIDAPGMEWLVPKDDPYYGLIKKMSDLDYKNLPNADIVVGFKIKKDIWLQFLEDRGRILDKDESFIKQCFFSQDGILQASKNYAERFKKDYIEVEQEYGSPETTANTLEKKLRNLGVIL